MDGSGDGCILVVVVVEAVGVSMWRVVSVTSASVYGIVSGWMFVVGMRLENEYGVGSGVGLFSGDAVDVNSKVRAWANE